MPKGTGRPLTRGQRNILQAMRDNPQAARKMSESAGVREGETFGTRTIDKEAFARRKRAGGDNYKAYKIKESTMRPGGKPKRRK